MNDVLTDECIYVQRRNSKSNFYFGLAFFKVRNYFYLCTKNITILTISQSKWNIPEQKKNEFG